MDEALAQGSGTVGGVLSASTIPARLARRIAAEAEVPWDRSLGQLRKDERLKLIELLTRYPLPWTGDEGYKKAEVTGGGIDLAEIDLGPWRVECSRDSIFAGRSWMPLGRSEAITFCGPGLPGERRGWRRGRRVPGQLTYEDETRTNHEARIHYETRKTEDEPMSMRPAFLILTLFSLSGCASMSGSRIVTPERVQATAAAYRAIAFGVSDFRQAEGLRAICVGTRRPAGELADLQELVVARMGGTAPGRRRCPRVRTGRRHRVEGHGEWHGGHPDFGSSRVGDR